MPSELHIFATPMSVCRRLLFIIILLFFSHLVFSNKCLVFALIVSRGSFVVFCFFCLMPQIIHILQEIAVYKYIHIYISAWFDLFIISIIYI
jgi:hypothetical protein